MAGDHNKYQKDTGRKTLERNEEMTDTEIIDWMQQSATGIHEDINERMTVTWLDKSGIPRTTEGDNLRDCVRGAMADANSRKDTPPVRTLGNLLREAAERGLPEKYGHEG